MSFYNYVTEERVIQTKGEPLEYGNSRYFALIRKYFGGKNLDDRTRIENKEIEKYGSRVLECICMGDLTKKCGVISFCGITASGKIPTCHYLDFNHDNVYGSLCSFGETIN